MADGRGCICAARCKADCGCDADWTPQELIDARAEIERLLAWQRILLDEISCSREAALSEVGGNSLVEMHATLTDAEREAVERAAAWMVRIAKDRGEIHSAGYFVDDAATLRGLLERTAH